MRTRTHYAEINQFICKDGSSIRELMHPSQHAVKKQSFAEATIAINAETQLHKHLLSEEIYHITQGEGWMTLGDEKLSVCCGDTICIAPGTAHNIKNTGATDLKIICSCAPAYSHDDTILL
jgi:mannose-6-phosphate isomerase-like protein (cupin superfamily)